MMTRLLLDEREGREKEGRRKEEGRILYTKGRGR